MRIVQLNLAADPALDDPDRLLDAYHTLTGWSDALTEAGAVVHVVQRFTHDAARERGGVRYEFIQDGGAGTLRPWAIARRVVEAARRAPPDVVHVNGLMFPGMVRALRAELPAQSAIVLQDHSGVVPRRSLWPRGSLRVARWRRAFERADACSFTARALAERWHERGLPRDVPVLEIPEASTRLAPVARPLARERTGLAGTPAILWVGRFDAIKDPETVLHGLARALPDLPGARVWMIASARSSSDAIKRQIATSEALGERVCVIGPVDHHAMPGTYSAADIFVSGSRHEGSGYALIEALACGVAPCVTDIPAHRALLGGVGTLWPPGDADAFAAALRSLAQGNLEERRAEAQSRFTNALSWRAIGRQTFAAYADLLRARRAVGAPPP